MNRPDHSPSALHVHTVPSSDAETRTGVVVEEEDEEDDDDAAPTPPSADDVRNEDVAFDAVDADAGDNQPTAVTPSECRVLGAIVILNFIIYFPFLLLFF